MKKMRMFLISLPAALAIALCPLSFAQAHWEVTKTMHIGGQGGWDYITVDSHTHRLFVTRSTHTMVIDAATGKLLGDIGEQNKSHGTALVPKLGRGFITDGGGSGAILVFDLKTYAILGKLAALPDADGIVYDKPENMILAVAGDARELMTFKPDIDPIKGEIDPPIELGGKPEFLAYDESGKVYIDLADKDVVAVVDLKTRKVIARWPVAPGGHPTSMAIDGRNHRLFIGCRNPQKLIVMSTEDGKVIADLPIGTGVDATMFQAGDAFVSCGDGSLIVAGEKAGKFEVEQVVTTPKGARTIGIDGSAHKLYLPTAEFTTPEPGSGSQRSRPKPDTFMIVEVAQTAAQ